MSDIIVPDNVEIVFEYYCKGCDRCDPEIITDEASWSVRQAVEHRIRCKNTEVCANSRSMAASESAKEYPFV